MENSSVDFKLEELVFLFNASEGNPGIYELVWELGHYSLKIEDKYKFAHEILNSLLKNEFIILEKITGLKSQKQNDIVEKEKSEDILNNPSSWYPSNETYSINLTEKGKNYLNDQSRIHQGKLQKRLFNTSQNNSI